MKSSEHQYYPVLNRIMLGFRPIAPKPAGGEATVSGGATKIATRTKRKYVRVRERRCTVKRKTKGIGKSSPPQKSQIQENSPPQKVTLQLLPAVRSESDDNSSSKIHLDLDNINNNNSDFNTDYQSKEFTNYCDKGGESARLLVTKTWIIVECVKDALMRDDRVGLGFSDLEMINHLKTDTCPGFVSDGGNRVVWVNEAYRRMVGAESGVMVWLVVKERFPDFSPSFACRVRVVQEKKQGQMWNKIVECDVWRMEFAGFAWRLDVKTALGLSI